MTTDEVKRKLAAILSADAKEYSRLMRDDEAATVRTLTDYRGMMTTLIRQHHGRVVDSPGDNILAEFASVVDAVQGAVAIQKELKSRNSKLPENRRMMFRIGINLGDVIVEGERIYGDGVNIAARLEGLAEPGGICISRTAYDQIEDKLPLGYEYLGEKTIKNIPKPVHAYRVLLEPKEAAPKLKREKKGKGAKSHSRPSHLFVEKETEKRRRHRTRFYRYIQVYLSVIGLLFIINMLTTMDTLWFHWPALGWGLVIYLYWLHLAKRERTDYKDRRKDRFQKHLGTYVGVIGFLFIINMLTYGGTIWFHWPALGWGLILFLHWKPSFRSSSRRQEEIETEEKEGELETPTKGNEPRYLRIQVEPKGSETSKEEVVNIRIPIKILKTGVALSAYLPEHAKAKVNDALKERGFSLDILSLDDEKLSELLESLFELHVDVEKDDKKVRIYCE